MAQLEAHASACTFTRTVKLHVPRLDPSAILLLTSKRTDARHHGLLAFVVAVLVFLALPGPYLRTADLDGKGGFRAGAAATLGVIVGDQVLLVARGARRVGRAARAPLLFKTLQYAGVAYLVYVGLCLIFPSRRRAQPVRIQAGHYFRQHWLITLLNPKRIVFYMAFFPLFIDPQTQQGLVTFGAMALTIALLDARLRLDPGRIRTWQ